jgi:pimeloyl-ACP methyl ester carboxylesterase
LRNNAWMSPEAARDLRDLFRWTRSRYGARRFVLVGGSMGGASVLAYAALHPEDASAVVALCPAADIGKYAAWCEASEAAVCAEIGLAIRAAYGGDPDDVPGVYTARSPISQAARLTMPIYVCHGARDAVIPVSPVRELSRAREGRSSFRYEDQPDGDHETPLSTMPKGLDWVLGRLTSS